MTLTLFIATVFFIIINIEADAAFHSLRKDAYIRNGNSQNPSHHHLGKKRNSVTNDYKGSFGDTFGKIYQEANEKIKTAVNGILKTKVIPNVVPEENTNLIDVDNNDVYGSGYDDYNDEDDSYNDEDYDTNDYDNNEDDDGYNSNGDSYSDKVYNNTTEGRNTSSTLKATDNDNKQNETLDEFSGDSKVKNKNITDLSVFGKNVSSIKTKPKKIPLAPQSSISTDQAGGATPQGSPIGERYPNFPVPPMIPIPLFYNSGEEEGSTGSGMNDIKTTAELTQDGESGFEENMNLQSHATEEEQHSTAKLMMVSNDNSEQNNKLAHATENQLNKQANSKNVCCRADVSRLNRKDADISKLKAKDERIASTAAKQAAAEMEALAYKLYAAKNKKPAHPATHDDHVAHMQGKPKPILNSKKPKEDQVALETLKQPAQLLLQVQDESKQPLQATSVQQPQHPITQQQLMELENAYQQPQQTSTQTMLQQDQYVNQQQQSVQKPSMENIGAQYNSQTIQPQILANLYSQNQTAISDLQQGLSQQNFLSSQTQQLSGAQSNEANTGNVATSQPQQIDRDLQAASQHLPPGQIIQLPDFVIGNENENSLPKTEGLGSAQSSALSVTPSSNPMQNVYSYGSNQTLSSHPVQAASAGQQIDNFEQHSSKLEQQTRDLNQPSGNFDQLQTDHLQPQINSFQNEASNTQQQAESFKHEPSSIQHQTGNPPQQASSFQDQSVTSRGEQIDSPQQVMANVAKQQDSRQLDISNAAQQINDQTSQTISMEQLHHQSKEGQSFLPQDPPSLLTLQQQENLGQNNNGLVKHLLSHEDKQNNLESKKHTYLLPAFINKPLVTKIGCNDLCQSKCLPFCSNYCCGIADRRDTIMKRKKQ